MSRTQGRAGYISAVGIALRNGLLMALMALMGVVGTILFFAMFYGPELDRPEGGLAVVGLILGPILVILNPLALIHCVLYVVVLSILLWRTPGARRGGRHIVCSGLTALATGVLLVLLTLPNWGPEMWWMHAPIASLSTILFTMLGLVVPAGLHGLRSLTRRFARAARARRGP